MQTPSCASRDALTQLLRELDAAWKVNKPLRQDVPPVTWAVATSGWECMRKSENTKVPGAFMKLRRAGRNREGKVKSSDQKRPPTVVLWVLFATGFSLPSPRGVSSELPLPLSATTSAREGCPVADMVISSDSPPDSPPALPGSVPNLSYQKQDRGSLSLCHVGSRGGMESGDPARRAAQG